MKRLAGQTATYGISSVVGRLLGYLLVPYFTRIMTKAQFGEYTDMYALIPFALIVLTLGMESGYFRFAGKASTEEEKRRVFATAWGIVTLVSAVFMATVLMFKGGIATLTDYTHNPSFIWIVGTIITVDAVSAIPFARLREQGRAVRYVILRLVSVIINIGFTVFFFSWLPFLAEKGILTSIWSPGFGVGYALVANLAASAITFLMLLPSCDRIAPRISGKLLRSMFLFSLPLLVSGIAGTANEFIDRQMIKYLMPTGESMEALGVYGAVVKIGVVMLLFTQMYRLAAEPFFLAEFKGDDFRKSNAEAMKYYVIVSVFIFLVIALYSDVFALIVGTDFRVGIYILPVVLVANMLSGVVLNLSFWYKQLGRTWMAIWITGTGLLFTVVFNVILVPKLGYYGAAIARLICEIAMVALSYALCRRYYPISYDLKRIGGYVLAGAALYGAGILAADLAVWPRYFLCLVLIAAFLAYAVKREKIDLKALTRSVVKRKG